MDIILKNTPYKKQSLKQYPIWFSEPLIKCIEEKSKAHKRFKKFKNPRDYDTFALLRTRSKKMIDECFHNFIGSVEDSLLSDSTKLFWTYVKSNRTSSDIPLPMMFDGNSATSYSEACQLFSDYFKSVYDDTNLNCDLRIDNDNADLGSSSNLLSKIILTTDEVLKILSGLDTSKGAGPDGIPSCFVKSCSKELVLPLTIIFNKSLSSGIFPQVWKNAYIVPIHKSDDKSQCSNYRPISILNCFAKIFESLIFEHIYSHINSNIVKQQHGFVRGKSTVSNLLEYTEYLSARINN
ncbi:hypothetical protein JYU34_022680, partial [Plutella xylostella]